MPANVGRVFIVGCPRSGTTLVQSLLAAHSRVVAFTESHLFDKGFLCFGRFSVLKRERLKPFVAKFVQENELIAANGGSELLASDGIRSARETARRIISVFDRTAQACDADYWVEKTPDHVFRISLIRSVAPQARFIHVVRQADAVLPSLYLASRDWGRQKSWLSCALHWTAALWNTRLYAHGVNHLVVSYESLLEQRGPVTQAIVAWLGLPWDERILTDYTKAAARLVAPGETWKSANLDARRPTPKSQHLSAPLWTRAITGWGPYHAVLRRSVHV